MPLFDEEFDDILKKKLTPEKKKPMRKKRKKQITENTESFIGYGALDNEIKLDLEFAIEHGMEELSAIYDAYKRFIAEIGDLALSKYLTSFVCELGKACDNLEGIINNEVDISDVEEEYGFRGINEYNKLRATILSSIWNKYHKGGEPGEDVPF